MIIHDTIDQSAELCEAIKQALDKSQFQAIVDLMERKTTIKKLSQLKDAIDNKKVIVLHLHEMYGKNKVPRYEVVIDFSKEEVHVAKINLEHIFTCSKFEVR